MSLKLSKCLEINKSQGSPRYKFKILIDQLDVKIESLTYNVLQF